MQVGVGNRNLHVSIQCRLEGKTNDKRGWFCAEGALAHRSL
jgi:hypothetical protein